MKSEPHALHVAAVLKAAGREPRHLVRLNWYVTDRAEYAARQREIGEAYRRVLGRHFPAMTLLVVAGLLEPGAKVEIEATAVLPAWIWRRAVADQTSSGCGSATEWRFISRAGVCPRISRPVGRQVQIWLSSTQTVLNSPGEKNSANTNSCSGAASR